MSKHIPETTPFQPKIDRDTVNAVIANVCGGLFNGTSRLRFFRIFSVRLDLLDAKCLIIWRPQGDSNPRYRRERAMS